MKQFLIAILLTLPALLFSQNEYEPSENHPFGQANPTAPEQIHDFDPMIGICDCISKRRLSQDEWAPDEKMTWAFKFIMNGMAVQDETLKADGVHSGSIRQFNADSSRWYVHYYTSATATPTLSAWEGNKTGDKIILYRKQAAPNGMDGYYRITFYDVTSEGFKWIGEWVNLAETFSYPTWEIDCVKRRGDAAKAKGE